MDAKDRRLAEIEEASRETEEIVKETSAKLRSAESENKELGEKIAGLRLEASASEKRFESELASLEENAKLLKSETISLRDRIKEHEKKESDMAHEALQMQSAIEARDKKIETDIKYYERLVREINELRQRSKQRS